MVILLYGYGNCAHYCEQTYRLNQFLVTLISVGQSRFFEPAVLKIRWLKALPDRTRTLVIKVTVCSVSALRIG
jgi:hypothetical protein